MLAAMMLMMRKAEHERWSPGMVADLVKVQSDAMRFRRQRLDVSEQLDDELTPQDRNPPTDPLTTF